MSAFSLSNMAVFPSVTCRSQYWLDGGCIDDGPVVFCDSPMDGVKHNERLARAG
jgi:hypothetical protein